MGFIKVEMGKNLLGIEGEVAWATPGNFTVNNFPCGEDGTGCRGNVQSFIDPSTDTEAMQRRLASETMKVTRNVRIAN
jgi:hypothetical protein